MTIVFQFQFIIQFYLSIGLHDPLEMYTTTKSENNEQNMQQKLEISLLKHVIVRPNFMPNSLKKS